MNQQFHKRVSGASLSQHLGQAVTLLGEFMQLESNGRIFTLKAPSNDIVTVQLQEPVQELIEGIVEVRGTVGPNNTIKCQQYVNFPKEIVENIDMMLYNDVITVAERLNSRYITMP